MESKLFIFVAQLGKTETLDIFASETRRFFIPKKYSDSGAYSLFTNQFTLDLHPGSTYPAPIGEHNQPQRSLQAFNFTHFQLLNRRSPWSYAENE